MVCQPVSSQTLLGPTDVGPHFKQSGELWWYLAVMTPLASLLDRPIGVQFSIFRKATGGCTDTDQNLIVSTAAVSHAGKYYQATRLFPTTKHAMLRAQPYALSFDREWGISADTALVHAPANATAQRLVASTAADGLPLSLNLTLSVPTASVLMADRGYANLNGTLLGHISKPRQPAHGSVSFGGRLPIVVSGDVWLQHIWWTTPPGGAFPQWNWFVPPPTPRGSGAGHAR